MGTLRKLRQGIKSFFQRSKAKPTLIPESFFNVELSPKRLLKSKRKKRSLAVLRIKKLKARKWK